MTKGGSQAQGHCSFSFQKQNRQCSWTVFQLHGLSSSRTHFHSTFRRLCAHQPHGLAGASAFPPLDVVGRFTGRGLFVGILPPLLSRASLPFFRSASSAFFRSRKICARYDGEEDGAGVTVGYLSFSGYASWARMEGTICSAKRWGRHLLRCLQAVYRGYLKPTVPRETGMSPLVGVGETRARSGREPVMTVGPGGGRPIPLVLSPTLSRSCSRPFSLPR